MPNGRKGDNPITDILIWNCNVYGPEIDSLVREVDALLKHVNPPIGLNEETGEIVESPFSQQPLAKLVFAAEDDPAQRPRLREELLPSGAVKEERESSAE
jgi:hypothetical protein